MNVTTLDTRSSEQKVFDYLESVESFTLEELRAFREPLTSERDWRQMIWVVQQKLQNEQGVVFRPLHGRYTRADWQGTARRAANFAKAHRRKGERVVKLTEIAAERTPDPQMKARLERLALKRANQILDFKRAIREAAKPKI